MELELKERDPSFVIENVDPIDTDLNYHFGQSRSRITCYSFGNLKMHSSISKYT
jgi:hypothetical protein